MQLLLEVRSIRTFFHNACRGQVWAEDFTLFSSTRQNSDDSCSVRAFDHQNQVLIKNMDNEINPVSREPLGNYTPVRNVSREQNDSRHRKFSRSDMSNLGAQLEHMRSHKVVQQERVGVLPSQQSFEEEIVQIDDQWRYIKEIHPELGSLFYTMEKRLEIDNRYGNADDDEDIPAVCDIGVVIKAVELIDVTDSSMDAFVVLKLHSFRTELDRKFYGSPFNYSPDITLNVAELSVVSFKYKNSSICGSCPIELNAELWCLSKGKTVHRAVTKSLPNDRYPCWQDVLKYTYQSNNSTEIVDELVIILCQHQPGLIRSTFKDVPLGYARISVSAIDVCTDVNEFVGIYPLQLSDDDWIKISSTEDLPSDLKRRARTMRHSNRRSGPNSSQRPSSYISSTGTVSGIPDADEVGEMHICFSGVLNNMKKR